MFQVESMSQGVVQLKKEQVVIQFDTVHLSLIQSILHDSNNYTQIKNGTQINGMERSPIFASLVGGY